MPSSRSLAGSPRAASRFALRASGGLRRRRRLRERLARDAGRSRRLRRGRDSRAGVASSGRGARRQLRRCGRRGRRAGDAGRRRARLGERRRLLGCRWRERVPRQRVAVPGDAGLLLGQVRGRLLPPVGRVLGSGHRVQHAGQLLQRALRAGGPLGRPLLLAVLPGERHPLRRAGRLLLARVQWWNVRRAALRHGRGPLHGRQPVLLGALHRRSVRPGARPVPADRRGLQRRRRHDLLLRLLQRPHRAVRPRSGGVPRDLQPVQLRRRLLPRRVHTGRARRRRVHGAVPRRRAGLQLERRLLRRHLQRHALAVRGASAELPLTLPWRRDRRSHHAARAAWWRPRWASLAASCSRFGPLYPPRPAPSEGLPAAEPLPARVVAHLTVTSAALQQALDAAAPRTGDGTVHFLGGDRAYTWERGPLDVGFSQGRVVLKTTHPGQVDGPAQDARAAARAARRGGADSQLGVRRQAPVGRCPGPLVGHGARRRRSRRGDLRPDRRADRGPPQGLRLRPPAAPLGGVRARRPADRAADR